MKVYGGTSAHKTQLLLVQNMYHSTQSISIFVPGNEDNEKVYICVGIESKVDDEVTCRKKSECVILSIHQAFKQLVVNDTSGAIFVRNQDYKDLPVRRKQLDYEKERNQNGLINATILLDYIRKTILRIIKTGGLN
ncbi:unnamed protein product [Adineta steineri]|uniref:Uncharacterized protein n=1 Tax=Adineta steineri TaxID=433720 RepID=A0A819A1S7_9BILA|nr:unnamed protein product [Adineta steineri]